MSMQRSPSSLVADPPVAGRRFRFQVRRGDRDTAKRRRLEVADHVASWVPLRIIDEHEEAGRVWLWLEADRLVSLVSAADFAKQCPGYVPGSFVMLDGRPSLGVAVTAGRGMTTGIPGE
jgi:hypothetical protein